MANRYWVGGGANAGINATGPTNWSDVSGGTNNFSVPTSADDVFFTSASSAAALFNVSTSWNSLDANGYVGTVTYSNSVIITIAGSGTICRFPSGGSWNWGGGTGLAFTGTSGLTLIYTQGRNIGSNFIVNAPGGGVQLQDHLNHIASNAFTLTLTAGTFDANNFNVTTGGLVGSAANVRTLTMGSGLWSVGSVNSNPQNWSLNATSLTFNKGTADLVFTAVGGGTGWQTGTLTFGGLTYNNLTIHGAGSYGTKNFNITQSATWATITFNNSLGGLLIHWSSVGANIRQTCTNLVVVAPDPNRPMVWDAVANPTQPIGPIVASGSVSVSNVAMSHITASGGATFMATNSFDLGGNVGWTITPPVLTQTLTATLYVDTVEAFGVPLVGQTVIRVMGEAVNLVETLTTFRPLIRIIIETINLNEALTIFRARLQVLAETVRANEALTVFRSIVRAASETLNLNEARNTFRALARQFGETVNLGETRVVNISTDIIKVIAETVRAVETTVSITAATIVQVLNETVRLNETLASMRALARVISETVNLNEARVTFRPLVRLIGETVNLGEALVASRALARVLAETVRLNEALSVFRPLVRLISETVNLGEALTTFRALARSTSETVQAVETRLGLVLAAIIQIVNETVRSNELINTTRQISQAVNETVRVAEATVRAMGLTRTRAETVNLVEVIVRQRSLVRLFAEVESVNEGLTTTRIMVRLRPEQVSLNEQPLGARRIIQAISEGLHLSEAFAHLTTIPSLVCSAIKIYAMFAGECGIAPMVMGSTVIEPEVEGGLASIYAAVDSTTGIKPAVAGDVAVEPAVDGQLKFEEDA